MRIRRATIEDVPAIYGVEEDCFSVPWSMESITNDLVHNPKSLYLVVEVDGAVVGYGGAWIVADEGQITNIAIKKEFRRDGYGGRLVRRLLKEIFKESVAEVFLEVRFSNVAALALYRRFGFTVKGIRKQYYTDPVEDAYIMSLLKEEETP